MGLADDRALSAVRLSVGRWTTGDEVDLAAGLLAAAAGAALTARSGSAYRDLRRTCGRLHAR